MGIDISSARAAIESGMSEAQEMLRSPSSIDDLLISLEGGLKQIPVAGETLADIPLMISMVKSYITKEYTDVSMKVILVLVSSFIYFVKKKDIIPDSIPIAGQLDDFAILKFAMDFVKPELQAYSQWRDARRSAASAETTRAAQPSDSAEAAQSTDSTQTAQPAATAEAAKPSDTAETAQAAGADDQVDPVAAAQE